jgi:V/A-type H+-transporting ATPase subunit A
MSLATRAAQATQATHVTDGAPVTDGAHTTHATHVAKTPGDHSARVGRITRISGPVVSAVGLPDAHILDVVRVGHARLLGEIITLERDHVVLQVFEDTAGLAVGDPVHDTGEPLHAELGPGLLGAILDGTGRPLDVLRREVGVTVPRGIDPPTLDRDRVWTFTPAVSVGDQVVAGDVLGSTPEGQALTHRLLVPPGRGGTVTAVHSGPSTVTDPVVAIDGEPVTLLQRWPLRTPRPAQARLPLDTPLVTGQRVLDLLFPVARGGSAIIPGGFGTGKTVLEQALAKHAEVDVVVYVACGERGNELAEVLEEFPGLVDPRSGAPLMERTVLVANTSNMPVAAREASIFTGITIAEYFRDQGLDVALMADSTSRWGEALREVSSRLEEMPAEDGYPAYLANRLAGFYERAGAVQCLGAPERTGSVTLVGAVSPAGGDFSEPITQHSLRLAGCFWGLDTALSRQRHFPAVNWTRSHTAYQLDAWFDREIDPAWSEGRRWATAILAEESALQEVISLLGMEALAPAQRVTVRIGRLLREDFLQQSSFDEVDANCPPAKAIAMIRVARAVADALGEAQAAGVDLAEFIARADTTVLADLGQMRRWTADEAAQRAQATVDGIPEQFQALRTGADR